MTERNSELFSYIWALGLEKNPSYDYLIDVHAGILTEFFEFFFIFLPSKKKYKRKISDLRLGLKFSGGLCKDIKHVNSNSTFLNQRNISLLLAVMFPSASFLKKQTKLDKDERLTVE